MLVVLALPVVSASTTTTEEIIFVDKVAEANMFCLNYGSQQKCFDLAYMQPYHENFTITVNHEVGNTTLDFLLGYMGSNFTITFTEQMSRQFADQQSFYMTTIKGNNDLINNLTQSNIQLNESLKGLNEVTIPGLNDKWNNLNETYHNELEHSKTYKNSFWGTVVVCLVLIVLVLFLIIERFGGTEILKRKYDRAKKT